MTTIAQVCMAVQIASAPWSTSGNEWALIINSRGVDVLNKTVRYARSGFGEATLSIFSAARQFPPEGFARVYTFGMPALTTTPLFSDQAAVVDLLFDTAPLDASSVRMTVHGHDLLRPQHIVLWGYDDMMAVVPLTLDVDMAIQISEDPVEGPGSIPLTLVDSGGVDSAQLSEVVLYVALAKDANAGTRQPVTFRVEDAAGSILFDRALEGFGDVERDTRNGQLWWEGSGSRNARMWRLTDTTAPFRRVDGLGRTVIPKLMVTGPDNAMIEGVVAFGVDRSGARPAVVPLVHHFPAIAGTNPWVGTHSSPDEQAMVLPLCDVASRQ